MNTKFFLPIYDKLPRGIIQRVLIRFGSGVGFACLGTKGWVDGCTKLRVILWQHGRKSFGRILLPKGLPLGGFFMFPKARSAPFFGPWLFFSAAYIGRYISSRGGR
ncbi:unnamed protein product [Ectocarpus sp. 13 AM-2016]